MSTATKHSIRTDNPDVASRARPIRQLLGALMALGIYIGIPILAQAIDPIWTNQSLHSVHTTLTRLPQVWNNFINGTNMTPDVINLMVMVLWIFWIYLILSTLISLFYIARHKTVTPRMKQMTRLASLIIFLVWQGVAAGHGAAPTVHHSSSPTSGGSPSISIQLSSASTPVSQGSFTLPSTNFQAPSTTTTTTYTVQPGDSVWSIAAHQLPGNPSPEAIAAHVEAIATLNNLSNPSLISVGQQLQLPGTAVETPAPVQFASLDVPLPSLSIPSPTVATAGDMTVAPHSTSQQSNVLDEAAAVLASMLLVGASVQAIKKRRSLQRKRRPAGTTLALPTDLAMLVEYSDAEKLYLDVTNTLRLLTGMGAPGIVGMWVSKHAIEIEFADASSMAQLDTQFFETVDQATVSIARPVPTVTVTSNGNPYGMLVYVGVDKDGDAYFCNLGRQGVLGIPNAPVDFWRSILVQFGWNEWLRTTYVHAYGADDFSYDPSAFADSVRPFVSTDPMEFASHLHSESELLQLVSDEIRSINSLRASHEVADASASATRLDSDTFSTSIVITNRELSEYVARSLVEQLGNSDTMTVLTANGNLPASHTWQYDAGALMIVDHRGETRAIRSALMSESQLIKHVAFMLEGEQFIPNTLKLADLQRPGVGDAPMLKVCVPGQPYVSGIDSPLSPLAVRMVTILCFASAPISLDEMALTLGGGLTVATATFMDAWTEVVKACGEWITASDGLVLLSSDFGTDLGILTTATQFGPIETLLEAPPFGEWAYQWIWAAQRVDAITSRLLDTYITTALNILTKQNDIGMATAFYNLLVSVFGTSDRLELLRMALVKVSDPSQARQLLIDLGEQHAADDTTFDSRILAEAERLLVS